jgi:hypothetical protein
VSGRAVSSTSVVVAASGQVWCNLSGEAAILSLQSGVYYGLERVGARVWHLLQTPVAVRDICRTVAAEYDVLPERCERDVIALLERLAAERLIEVQDALAA